MYQVVVDELQLRLETQQEESSRHIEELKEEKAKEVNELKADLAERKKMIAFYERFNDVERHQILQQIEDLNNLTDLEKQAREAEILQLEQEKNERMEKMRKEMLMEVKQVKIDMLNFTEDKLQGTTRLTIKQNKQLTSELEFQSKQTENLIYQNGTMATEIKVLQKDLKLHQEVEKELAKRSHFCQKVINKYQESLKTLKKHLADLHNGIDTAEDSTILKVTNDNTDDLTQFLEQRISEIEIKLKGAQSDLEALREEHVIMVAKVTKERRKFQNSALLLSEYLDEVLQEAGSDLISEDQDIHLDVEKLKTFERIEDVPAKDQVGLLLVLLKQLQPFLNQAQHTGIDSPQADHEHKTSLLEVEDPSSYKPRQKTTTQALYRRGAQTSMEENYPTAAHDNRKSRSPAHWLNDSTEVSKLGNISQLQKSSGMSRNPKERLLATHYTTSKQSRQQYLQNYSTQAKTLSTKAGSLSRPSLSILPHLTSQMSR